LVSQAVHHASRGVPITLVDAGGVRVLGGVAGFHVR